LLLALLVVVVSLGLMTVGESFEAYTESKLLIKAVKNGDRLGMGDLRLLEVTKMILPRLTSYYVVLAVFLFVLAAVFPFAWADFLLYSVMLFGFAIQVGSIGGLAGWMVSLGLYALMPSSLVLSNVGTIMAAGECQKLRQTSNVRPRSRI